MVQNNRTLLLSGLIALALLAAGVALLTLLVVDLSIVQLAFGLVLALVLPGYLVTQALLPRSLIGLPERIVLSVGVSLAVAALGGLVLNLTPWGLERASWSLLLVGVCVFFFIIAVVRRAWEVPHVAIGLRVRDGLLLGLALVIGIAALTIARAPAPSPSIEGYTNLWVVPSESTKPAVGFGVSSSEVSTIEYSLEIKVNGQVVSRAPNFTLRPGEKWEATLDVSAAGTGSPRVEADLYRLDRPQSIYRQVVLDRNK